MTELTNEQAKRYFKSMGCSHFHMAREDSGYYSKYKCAGITKEMELEWKKESFEEHLEKLGSKFTNEENLWFHHVSAAELAENIKTIDALDKLFQASSAIKERMPTKRKVLCAEDILGRDDVSCKKGIVFSCIDLGRNDLAKKFIELSKIYALESGNDDIERCNEVINLAVIINECIS